MTVTIKAAPGIEGMRRAERLASEMGDGWTITTKDRSLSAQWEHTVLCTESGFEILTLSVGSPPAPPGLKVLAPAAAPGHSPL